MTTPLAAFMKRQGWSEAATALAADRCAATITRWLQEGAVVADDGVVWSGYGRKRRVGRLREART